MIPLLNIVTFQIGVWDQKNGLNITFDYSTLKEEIAAVLKNKTLVVTTILVSTSLIIIIIILIITKLKE